MEREDLGLNDFSEQLLSIYDKVVILDLKEILPYSLDLKISKDFTFFITRSCNKRCLHCISSLDDTHKSLDLGRFEEVISSLCEKGVSDISLTGGEPMLCFNQFGDMFKIMKKYGMRINSIKTNMIHANKSWYKERFMDMITPLGLGNGFFMKGIEPSVDAFHENSDDIDGLLNIIDLNMSLISDSDFFQKRFMNISVMRDLDYSNDIDNTMKIINFISSKFIVELVTFVPTSGGSLNYESDNDSIKKSVIGGIQDDYFLLKVSDGSRNIFIRLGLNDRYRIGKGENIDSNLEHIGKGNRLMDIVLDRSRHDFINTVDIDGNLFKDEFFGYTNKMPLGNVSDGIDEVIEKNSYNPILIELKRNGLKRLLPILIGVYPQLNAFKGVIFEDFLMKILSMPNGYESLYVISFRLLMSKR